GEWAGMVAGDVRSEGERLIEQVVEFGESRGSRGDADADLVIGAADPGEFRSVKSRAGFVEQWIEGGAPAGRADHCAVARRRRIKIIGEAETASAFHVLRHDGRIAGNMVAEPTRDQARVKIITATDAVADVKIDRFAAIEIGDALRARRADSPPDVRQRQCYRDSRSQTPSDFRHAAPSNS